MGIQLKNNASGTLATAINASDTGIVLTTGNGASFPALGASDYFYATLESTGGTFEVIKVTARSGDSMTVVRAQEGSTANSFAAGSRIELRVTAQSVLDAVDQVTAAQVEVTPYSWIAATNVQAALNEIVDDLGASSGSSRIGFLQSGTGAVATTVQAKLRQTVSVKDFGAVGDGAVDDTAAIQAALDAHNSVYIPSGNYKITQVLRIQSNGSFFGDGFSSAIYNATDFRSISNELGASNIYIGNLKVYGNALPATVVAGRGGIVIDDASNVVINNVYVTDVNTGGIVIADCTNATLSNFIVENTSEHGVYVSLATNVSIANGVIVDAGQISTPAQGTGFKVASSNYVTATNIIIRNPSEYGLAIDGSVASPSAHLFFSDIYAESTDGTHYGCYVVSTVDDIRFSNCKFVGVSGALINSNISPSVPTNVFFSNVFAEGVDYGIRVIYGDDVYVTSGLLTGTQTGLRVETTSGNVFSNGQATTTNGTSGIFGNTTDSSGNFIPLRDNVFDLGTQSFRWNEGYIGTIRPGSGNVIWSSGTGTPEGVVTAVVGSLFTRDDGGVSTTLYVKTSGSGNTGWTAK